MAITKEGPGNGRNSISPIIDKMYGLSFISKEDDDTVEINNFFDRSDDFCENSGGSAQVEKEENIIL